MAKNSDFPYLHGFSQTEQDRLRQQARFAEFKVYQDINLSGVENLLEIGSGVGAQSEILLRRFPELKLTGIDLNDNQLAAAKASMADKDFAKGRYEYHKMDATNMDFKSNTFDGAFLCWVLEHIPSPQRVLSEARRVLKSGVHDHYHRGPKFVFFP